MSDEPKAEESVDYYKGLWRHECQLRLMAENEWRLAADERDRLRAAPTDALRKSTQGKFVDLEGEIERLRGALREVYFHLGPPQPPGHEVGEEGIPALVQKAMAERDRLRAELKEVRKKIEYFLTDRGLLPGDEVEINNRAWVLSIDESVVAEEGAPNFEVWYADGSKGTVPGFMVFRPRTNDQWKALYDIRNRTQEGT